MPSCRTTVDLTIAIFYASVNTMRETLVPPPPTPSGSPEATGPWYGARQEPVPPLSPAAPNTLINEQLLLNPGGPNVPEGNPVVSPSDEVVTHERVTKEHTPALVVRFNDDPDGDTVSIFDMEHHAGESIAYRGDPRTNQLKSFNHEALITLADGSTLFRKNDSIYSIDFDNPSATKKLVELDLEKETPGFVMGQGGWKALEGITDSPVVAMQVLNKHPKHQAQHKTEFQRGWSVNSAGEASPVMAYLSSPGESSFTRANKAVAGYKEPPPERTKSRFGFRMRHKQPTPDQETQNAITPGINIEGAWSFGTTNELTKPAVLADDEKGVFGLVAKAGESPKIDTHDASNYVNGVVHRLLTSHETPPANREEAEQRMTDAVKEVVPLMKNQGLAANFLQMVSIDDVTYGIWGRAQKAGESGIVLMNEDGEFTELTSELEEYHNGPAVSSVVLDPGDRLAMVSGSMLHEGAMSDDEIRAAFAGNSSESAEKFIKTNHGKDPNKGALVLHVTGPETIAIKPERRSRLGRSAAAMLIPAAAKLDIQRRLFQQQQRERAMHDTVSPEEPTT
jgi:hypothetical protein